MKPIVRDALGIGAATGAAGLSYGALAVAAGLTVPQACALSLLMFTGASQFAFVGLVGSLPAAVGTALLLGARNGLYGLRLKPFLARRALAAQFVIDESAAMSVRPTAAETRLGFWATGLSVFAFWNLATFAGAIAGTALSDPRALGLDAAGPACFLALLAPKLREAEPRRVAALAALAALVSVPFVPAGVPVLVAAAVAALAALGGRRESRGGTAPHVAGDAGLTPSAVEAGGHRLSREGV